MQGMGADDPAIRQRRNSLIRGFELSEKEYAMKTKKFYDIHVHVMDLSHANVIAFIKRLIVFSR